MSKKCIIIGNSKPVKKELIKDLKESGYPVIICADGAINKLSKQGIEPDVLIGDLDSVSDKAMRNISERTKVIRVDNQENTDVEKALDYAIENKFDEAILLSVTGRRIDHTLANISILLKYSEKIALSIRTKDSVIRAIKGKNRLHCRLNQRISMFSFNPDVRVTTSGLKYPLYEDSLLFGVRESISNIAEAEIVEIDSRNGYTIVISEW